MSAQDEFDVEVTELSGELWSRGRRTGVIVGCSSDVSPEQAEQMLRYLKEWFPEVTFAVVGHGAGSVAFEWDEPDEDET